LIQTTLADQFNEKDNDQKGDHVCAHNEEVSGTSLFTFMHLNREDMRTIQPHPCVLNHKEYNTEAEFCSYNNDDKVIGNNHLMPLSLYSSGRQMQLLIKTCRELSIVCIDYIILTSYIPLVDHRSAIVLYTCK